MQPPNDTVKLVMDNNDDSIIYSKGWHAIGTPTIHYTDQPMATASVSFNASFITVFGIVPSYNELHALGLNATTVLRSSFQIDDGLPEYFNVTLNAKRLTDQVFFQPNITLSDGPHTLIITNLGGPLMLEYLTMVPTDRRIYKIDDTSTNITYNNADTLSDNNQANYNGTLHRLSYPKATAFLNFNGDFIAVYGALPEGGPLPDVSFTLDNIVQPVPCGQSPPNSTLPLPTTRKRWISKVLFWQSSILNGNPHNLSIATKQGDFLLDFILIRTRSTTSPSLSPSQMNQLVDCGNTPLPDSSSTSPSSDPAAIVGGVLGTVSIILLCIVYFLFKRIPYLRSPTRSKSSHQTPGQPTCSRPAIARDRTPLHPVDGSGRPVKFYIPSSRSYRSRGEMHNGQDLYVDHGREKVQEVTYGHDEKFAMFQQM